MQDVFFSATKNGLKNITSIFDTVWPISVGLWNLRCAVNGIKTQFPEVSERELTAKFTLGSGIHGVNYTRAFEQKTWEEQKSDLAWMILNNTFCVFEGWLQELKETVFCDMNQKDLQFPIKARNEVARLVSTTSSTMKKSFYNIYSNKRERNYMCIDAWLYCFRVFKETRNCYMHHGKFARQQLIDAYSDYLPYANCTALDVSEIPEFFTPNLNDSINISLRGVVGFSHIIIKIMVTLDAELICSIHSETEFIKRYKEKHPTLRTLKSDTDSANNQICQYVKQAGFCKPEEAEQLKAFLLSNHLISK